MRPLGYTARGLWKTGLMVSMNFLPHLISPTKPAHDWHGEREGWITSLVFFRSYACLNIRTNQHRQVALWRLILGWLQESWRWTDVMEVVPVWASRKMLGPASYGGCKGWPVSTPTFFWQFCFKSRSYWCIPKGSEFMKEIFQKAVSCMTHAFQSNAIFGCRGRGLENHRHRQGDDAELRSGECYRFRRRWNGCSQNEQRSCQSLKCFRIAKRQKMWGKNPSDRRFNSCKKCWQQAIKACDIKMYEDLKAVRN